VINIGEAVAKAKSYVANQTGAPYHSLVLESFKSEQVSHVIEFIEVAGLGEKVYAHYLIEVDTKSGRITGFGKSGPTNPNPVIEPIKQQKEVSEPQFEIYKDTTDKFRFLLRTPNGEEIAVSKVYDSKAGCLKGIKIVKENAPKARIQDLN
jgi:uncharacterized protein YegP (UPF0339 family)